VTEQPVVAADAGSVTAAIPAAANKPTAPEAARTVRRFIIRSFEAKTKVGIYGSTAWRMSD